MLARITLVQDTSTHPFDMMQTAAQEASTSGGDDTAAQQAQQAQHAEGPPYTLKCANQMGDVRLTSRPPSPEQKVLYFTAQWERDGGGVYDVSKFVQPEVGFCSTCIFCLARVLGACLCSPVCTPNSNFM